MNITCPGCGYAATISDKLVPPEGRTVKCPKCREQFSCRPPVVVRLAEHNESRSLGMVSAGPPLPTGPTCPKCGSSDIVWQEKGVSAGGAIVGAVAFAVIGFFFFGVLAYRASGETFAAVAGLFGLLVGGIAGAAIGGLSNRRDPVRFCRACAWRWAPPRTIEQIVADRKRA